MRMNSRDESPGEVTGTTLEELERFRQEIERYRARRKAVSEEFEGFVRGFKNPAPALAPPAPQPERPAAVRAAAPPPAPVPAAPVSARPAPRPPAPSTVADVRPAAPVVEREAPLEVTPAPATRRSWLPLAIAAALLIAVAVWQFGRTGAGPSPTEAPAVATAAPPAAAPAAGPVAEPAPPPDPFESVLTTNRAVWLRVTADGNRVVSRELPAGARVPFKAEKSIEIRAGDAGAVRLSIGGRDQGALGADGAVVTRSFTVPR
jgi:hypothetical protein